MNIVIIRYLGEMIQKLKFEYKITAIYLIIGGIWIIFSDKLLNFFIVDSHVLTRVQTYKGWFYVIITAILLYSYLKTHLVKIRHAEQKARESDRLKTAFLQNISHEIRTPMNGIIGFAGLLDDHELSGDQKKEYLDIIIKSSERLLEIVNEVLDISMIETGNIHINEISVDLNLLLESIPASLEPLNTKGIAIELRKGLPDMNSTILTDPVKLRQIIVNLLSNAIKFTEKGKIIFGYKLQKEELEFFVEDTGVGIGTEFQKMVFDRFYKSHLQSNRFYDGVGLGLSICKGNVELLKGRIWFKSELNKGTTFFFTIPYKTVVKIIDKESERVSPLKKMGEIFLLVAEDEESNFRYIKEILKNTEIVVLHAMNGKEAVDMCKENPRINVVLMDIKMPEMDGYEATRLIRQFRPGLTIIAQTAYALVNEKNLAIDAGCDDYISKPFKREHLLSMINKYRAIRK